MPHAEPTVYRTPEQDRAEFASAFPDKAMAIEAEAQGKRLTSKSESEQALMDAVAEMHEFVRQIGVQPVTVVSLWPIPLYSSGPHVSHLVVPSCPIGQEFVTFKIEAYGTDVQDKGGRFDVKPIMPIVLARDILQQHSKTNTLIREGVVIYMGDHAPNQKNLADINEARKKLVKHMKKLVEDANGQWVRGGKNSNVITDVHRQAAEYLLHYRFLAKKPDWMITAREQQDIVALCLNCGAEPKTKTAVQCAACGYIVNPEQGYINGDVSASTPEGKRALSRLSREKLKSLGISELIEETVEERKLREQAEAKATSKKK